MLLVLETVVGDASLRHRIVRAVTHRPILPDIPTTASISLHCATLMSPPGPPMLGCWLTGPDQTPVLVTAEHNGATLSMYHPCLAATPTRTWPDGHGDNRKD